jgi:hypothetical protein
MNFAKISIFLALILTIGIFSCAEERKIEVPTKDQIPTEQITTNLVPPNVDAKGSFFSVELKDLKVIIKGGKSSKENVETPRLKGNIKITNKTNDPQIINRVTLEYLDEAGKPIVREPEERVVMGSPSTQWGWNVQGYGPGEFTEKSFDVPIPMSVIKEKSLRKIAVNLVYVSSLSDSSSVPGGLAFGLEDSPPPFLEQETLTLSVMLNTDFNI